MVRAQTLALSLVASLPATQLHAADKLPICEPYFIALAPIGTRTLSTPEVGQERTVEVGQAAISAIRGDVYARSIALAGAVDYEGTGKAAGFKVHIPAGSMAVGMSTSEVNLYPHYGAVVVSTRTGKAVTAQAGIALRNAEGAAPRVYWTKGFTSYADDVPEAKVTRSDCVELGAKGFRRELVYAGSTKDAVLLTYREYLNDLARPAFTQNLTYDRSEGDEVGFRGARLKILKATNTELTFVVLKAISASD